MYVHSTACAYVVNVRTRQCVRSIGVRAYNDARTLRARTFFAHLNCLKQSTIIEGSGGGDAVGEGGQAIYGGPVDREAKTRVPHDKMPPMAITPTDLRQPISTESDLREPLAQLESTQGHDTSTRLFRAIVEHVEALEAKED